MAAFPAAIIRSLPLPLPLVFKRPLPLPLPLPLLTAIPLIRMDDQHAKKEFILASFSIFNFLATVLGGYIWGPLLALTPSKLPI